MATKNSKGMYIEGHNDKHGTSHMNFYDKDPSSKGPHESIHINIHSDGTGTIVEKNGGTKTVTPINLKK